MILWCLFSLLGDQANEQNTHFEFNVGSQSEFSLDTHKGNIHIRRNSGDKLTVDVRVWDEHQGETLKYVDVIVVQEGNLVRAEVDHHSGSVSGMWEKRDYDSPYVDFTVSIPDRCSLTIDDHKSSFDVEAPMGRVSIESHKGQGHIYNIASSLSLETHKGKFKVEIASFQGARVETHKGDIELIIEGASDFELRAETHKGDISFEGIDAKMRREDEHDHHGYSARYKQGAGTLPLRLESHKGRIHVDVR